MTISQHKYSRKTETFGVRVASLDVLFIRLTITGSKNVLETLFFSFWEQMISLSFSHSLFFDFFHSKTKQKRPLEHLTELCHVRRVVLRVPERQVKLEPHTGSLETSFFVSFFLFFCSTSRWHSNNSTGTMKHFSHVDHKKTHILTIAFKIVNTDPC